VKKILIGIFLISFGLVSSLNGQSNLPNADILQAQSYLLEKYTWLNHANYGLETESVKQSAIGFHVQFKQTYKGFPIYATSAKVNLNFCQQPLSLFASLFQVLVEPTQVHTLIEPTFTKVWWQNAESLIPAYSDLVQNERGEKEELIIDNAGNVLSRKRLALFVKKDTLIQSKVFLPDPLTSAQKEYGAGGLYKNNNGADVPELNAERKPKGMRLKFENDTFYAENNYAIIKDLQAPSQIVFKSKQANFDFTRSQSQFREMNALYHIEVYRDYLKKIGLPFTSMYQMPVDPSAHFGADQSSFEIADLTLLLGTGGVPDAEDADVIIHEYTHGLNWFIAPNTISGNQRLAVEEANCDVMACFHSKAMSDYNWRWIFNWDGHNEFWDGRDGNTDNKYPDDLSADFYYSSLIWSGMLNDIGEDVGRDVLTRLLFQSVYSYANNLNMQEAANLLLQADSLLYNKNHFTQLQLRMQERGFNVSIGLQELGGLDPLVKVLNSAEFTQGIGAVTILTRTKESFSVQLIDLYGKLVFEAASEDNSLSIKASEIPAGTYILKVKMGDEQAYGKLLRY